MLCAMVTMFYRIYPIVGYSQGENTLQMHCTITFHEESVHEYLNPHTCEALKKRIFTGKLFTNRVKFAKIVKIFPLKNNLLYDRPHMKVRKLII